jgi:ComF family protein
MHTLFERARDGLFALSYPTPCRVCGKIVDSWDDGIACAECWEISAWPATTQFCGKCELPLPATLAPLSNQYCGTCDETAFTRARAGGPYSGAWRESVIWMKSHPQIAPRIEKRLQTLFTELAEIDPIDSILPIPLHPRRQAERGFNQAEVIALALSRATDVRLNLTSLERVRATSPHRAGLDAIERKRSLQGAFRVRAPRLIAGRAVLLIDDVMTTTATVHEAAAALCAAGAKSVSVLTLARVAYAPRNRLLSLLDD